VRPGVRTPLLLAACLAAGALLPLVTLAIPATVRIPRAADARRGAPAAQALFSHASHGDLRCYQCHPGLFPQGLVPFKHADMERGAFCAGCHDGQSATAVAALRCEACHVGR
jgi:c(7)-type cytochrome triheme protein